MKKPVIIISPVNWKMHCKISNFIWNTNLFLICQTIKSSASIVYCGGSILRWILLVLKNLCQLRKKPDIWEKLHNGSLPKLFTILIIGQITNQNQYAYISNYHR